MPRGALQDGQAEAICTWPFVCSSCNCGAVISSWGRMGCCYGLDTVGLHELQLAQSALLFSPLWGREWVWIPLEGMERILLGKMSPLTAGGRGHR